jgi:hypothetical protein
VGIAGEDDLDALDLSGQPAETSKGGKGYDAKRQTENGADQPIGRFAASRNQWSPPRQILEPEKSAALRERMLAEIVALATLEQATTWAQKGMAAKNTLNKDDCRVVEAAFAAQVADLDDGDGVRQGTVGTNSPAASSKATFAPAETAGDGHCRAPTFGLRRRRERTRASGRRQQCGRWPH